MSKDPVAEKSGFLCMYMSNHPDTLVSYVRYWGKVKEQVATAKLVSIDTKGMNLAYQPKGSAAATSKDVRVEFDPPLAGYEEVKPRLMEMKAVAEEQLGMVKAPQVTSFVVHPHMFPVLASVLFLVYSTFAPSMKHTKYARVFALGNAVLSYLPPWMTRASWAFAVVVHGTESVYVAKLCRRHRTGLVVGLQYLLSTLAVGYPTILSLRKQIQEARIASILKGQ
ncbi:hypothetical protein GSI_03451 [Ganoderma sinense ZZ0214-1]|uniref:DUF2470 domain-containing protein n=1 Tax=Ganoderma sinense ZZ0214-1 TaxID=1077348 RepID=A0A2G8SLP0_9APHY|nr:hypothetical protein GSI_03451 [Ganoderma sinense ZZ0214-1]